MASPRLARNWVFGVMQYPGPEPYGSSSKICFNVNASDFYLSRQSPQDYLTEPRASLLTMEGPKWMMNRENIPEGELNDGR